MSTGRELRSRRLEPQSAANLGLELGARALQVFQMPNTDGAVVAAGAEYGGLVGEARSADDARVTWKNGERATPVRIPEAHALVLARRGEQRAIGGKINAEDFAGVTR